jgi:hypothetical protein
LAHWAIIKPGHFSMEIPGQISAEIDSFAAINRFMEGEPTVAGAKIIGRWREMGIGHGFALVESDT